MKELWLKGFKNIQLILGTIVLICTVAVGSWTLITTHFIPRAEAAELIKKLDVETSYNKAFRLEQRIERIDRIKIQRELSPEEKKAMKRYLHQLQTVDEHIIKLEESIYNIKEKNEE